MTHRDWECDTLVPSDKRNDVKDIARQLVEDKPGSQINVILGGGRQMMGVESDDPNTHKKFNGQDVTLCQRMDKRNLIRDWQSGKFAPNKGKNRQYVQNRGELKKLKNDDVDYLLGLFSDNHMAYRSIEEASNNGTDGEPSLGEMVETAIDILEHGPNGFLLVVEGGRIDQAHHQNHARLALEEVIELDEAVRVALDHTKAEDTLIIVTADHSHALTLNGYPERGNDILGFANKVNVTPYETLTYANGPGYWTHRANDTNGTWVRVETLDEAERKAASYRHQAMMPLPDETHGGEEVAVYAHGAGSELIRGVFEQNYIPYAISYAACIGPARSMNAECNKNRKSAPLSNGQNTTMKAANSSSVISQSVSLIEIVLVAMVICRFSNY